MHVLFLTHYFPPEVNAPASRTFEHCRLWVREGHEVTVVTCVPNHPKGRPYPGYRNAFFQSETVEGIRVLRVWTYLAANEGFLKRTLNYVSYLVSVLAQVFRLPKPDVVVSTSPQFFCGLAGWPAARIKRAAWVLEIRDLWPDSILAVGALTNPGIIGMLKGIERKVYRTADRVAALTEPFRRHIIRCGADAGRVTVLPNGADLSRFQRVPRLNDVSDSLGLSDRFAVGYFGTHGMAHGLGTVLDAAERLASHKDVVLLLVGDGAERRRLEESKRRRGLDNVLMLGQVSKDRMPALLGSCDATMVLLIKNDLFKTVIPSKIFEAMALEKPIILGVEGESEGIVRQAECGICIEPENADALAQAVLTLKEDPERRRRLGENGRKYVEEYFDREVIARRYLDFLRDAVKCHKNR